MVLIILNFENYHFNRRKLKAIEGYFFFNHLTALSFIRLPKIENLDGTSYFVSDLTLIIFRFHQSVLDLWIFRFH